ncbi:MAG: hypothetical protein IKV59_01330 [Lachnospiraceae bacterium]|nr:hypothetical protein [Lachnospiraceae bacterium]
MKKIILYVPAVIFTLGVIVLTTILRDWNTPLWYAWALLLWISGFVMNKGKTLGVVIGCFPGIHLIYMSTQFTGQVINIELPLGLIIAIYYIGCGFVIWKKNHRGMTV